MTSMVKYKRMFLFKEKILSLGIVLNYIVLFYRDLLLDTLHEKECYVRTFVQGCSYFWLRFHKHKQKMRKEIQKKNLFSRCANLVFKDQRAKRYIYYILCSENHKVWKQSFPACTTIISLCAFPGLECLEYRDSLLRVMCPCS